MTSTSTNSERFEKYVFSAEAARIVGISKQAMAYLVRRGYFTTRNVAGRVLILRSEVELFAVGRKGRPLKDEPGKKRRSPKSIATTNGKGSEDYISQAEAANIRSVSKQAIADLIRRGRLTAVIVKDRTLVLRSEVEAFVPQPRTGRPPKKKIITKAPKSKEI